MTTEYECLECGEVLEREAKCPHCGQKAKKSPDLLKRVKEQTKRTEGLRARFGKRWKMFK